MVMQMIIVHSTVNEFCPNRDEFHFYPVEKMSQKLHFIVL